MSTEETPPTVPTRPGAALGRLARRVLDFLAEYDRVVERQALRNRPWEEEFLHWAWDGEDWQLHGHRPPPEKARRRPLGVTRDGWCPALPVLRAGAERPGPNWASRPTPER